VEEGSNKKRVAIAYQGGGSHTAFTAGVIKEAAPASSPYYNAWSPASQGVTRWKTLGRER
jgi:hypothetical protein